MDPLPHVPSTHNPPPVEGVLVPGNSQRDTANFPTPAPVQKVSVQKPGIFQRIFPKWTAERDTGIQIKSYLAANSTDLALEHLQKGVGEGLDLEKSKFRVLQALVKKNEVDPFSHEKLFASVINETNSDGNTALHLAVASGHLSAVNALLEMGCDPSIRNKDGKTAVQLIGEKQTPDQLKIIEALSTPEVIRLHNMCVKRFQLDKLLAKMAATPSVTIGGVCLFLASVGISAALFWPLGAAVLAFSVGYHGLRTYRTRKFNNAAPEEKQTLCLDAAERATGCHRSSEMCKYAAEKLFESKICPLTCEDHEIGSLTRKGFEEQAPKVKMLLEKGVNPNFFIARETDTHVANTRRTVSSTPLHDAITRGNVTDVQDLLEAGADPSALQLTEHYNQSAASTCYKKSPMDLAVGKDPVISVLLGLHSLDLHSLRYYEGAELRKKLLDLCNTEEKCKIINANSIHHFISAVNRLSKKDKDDVIKQFNSTMYPPFETGGHYFEE